MYVLRRHLDLELLHMHYGLQAMVLALSSMEVSTENESLSDKESDGTSIYLQHLREHLDAITTPVRRVFEHSLPFMYLGTTSYRLSLSLPTLVVFLLLLTIL